MDNVHIKKIIDISSLAIWYQNIKFGPFWMGMSNLADQVVGSGGGGGRKYTVVTHPFCHFVYRHRICSRDAILAVLVEVGW